MLRVPPDEAADAVADNDTLVGELAAVETKLKLPLKVPLLVGRNETVKLALAPAARLRGSARPLILKPLTVVLACWTVRPAVPVLRRVTV
jgi:hypothetical protein